MSYKKGFISILAFILLFAPNLGAKGNESYIYPLSSPVYSWLEEAYILEGMAHPSSSKPWSGGEVDNIINRIEEIATDERTLELIEKARKENESHSKDDDYISFSLTISPEIYAHTNSDEYNKEDMCGFMVLTTDAHF